MQCEYMLDIFEPNGTDWLGWEESIDNYYTYHHIEKRCNGGPATKDNGAILTTYAHRWLNKMELVKHAYYSELNELFVELNQTNKRPTQEYWDKLDAIHLKYADYIFLEPKGHNNTNKNKKKNKKKKSKMRTLNKY